MQFTQLDFDYSSQKKFLFGLFSDLHLDEADSDVKKFTADAKSVCDQGGRLFFNGDTGGFILPTDRKRFKRSSSIWDSDSNLNDIVYYHVDVLKEFADHIDVIGMGNHEESCMAFNNFNPIQAVVHELNNVRSKKLKPIQMSQYTGFINLCFRHSDKGRTRGYTIWHHHGRGGSAPVTKGMIDFARCRNYYADLYWLGHKHTCIVNASDSWVFPDRAGVIQCTPLHGIITPGYKRIVKQYDANELINRNGVPMPKGHKIDYSEGNFYSHPANGYGVIEIEIEIRNGELIADVSAKRR